MTVELILCAVLLGSGLWLIARFLFCRERSFGGRRGLRHAAKWQNRSHSLWEQPAVHRLVRFFSRFVFQDEAARKNLQRQLSRAGLNFDPEEFTARKYVILLSGAAGIGLCVLLQFWLGLILALLLTGYGLIHQKEQLSAKLRKRDEAIQAEMPRFVRTVCRSLRSSRDVQAALRSYRKVAGPELGKELDILLAHMRSGNTAAALREFQNRLNTDAAFRFCGILEETDRGIDQSAALEYLAEDMAKQHRLQLQKQLSTRPAQMRRTYLPAVGVCVVMVIYVLIIFIRDQLNNLF